MGKRGIKQVDVERKIIEYFELMVKTDNYDKNKIETNISILATHVYDNMKPTGVQYKSVSRAVINLEKKGLLYSRKIPLEDEYSKFSKSGKKYEKEIYLPIRILKSLAARC